MSEHYLLAAELRLKLKERRRMELPKKEGRALRRRRGEIR